jgi:hypothetical protein
MPSKKIAKTVRFTAEEWQRVIACIPDGVTPAAYLAARILGECPKTSKQHPPRIIASPSTQARLRLVAALEGIRLTAELAIEQVMIAKNTDPETALLLAACLIHLEETLHLLVPSDGTKRRQGEKDQGAS